MPASSKRRLTLLAVALALASYAGLAFGVGRLAVWAESEFETYPYRGGEEALRWLMPTMFDRRPDVLIVGPSAIGEDLRYEALSRAIGGRVVSLALSNGTLDDVTLALEYLGDAIGPNALPRHVILGMTPRVLANLPRNFGPRQESAAYAPLISTIDRYSTRFRVKSERLGSVLRPTTLAERWLARRNWATKQQSRYRSAVLAAVEHMIDPEPFKVGFQEGLPYFRDLRTPLDRDDWSTTIDYVRSTGFGVAARHWLPAYRSAYYNSFMAPIPPDTIALQVEDWDVVYDWNPWAEEELVRHQLRRLRELLSRHGIGLTVIHLPEHPLSRAEYDPVSYAGYRGLIAEELPDADIIDLWQVPAEKFFDQIHLTYEGAKWMTDEIAPALVRELR